MNKIFIGAILFLALIIPNQVIALSYITFGDPWYVVTYNPDISKLPKGFSIKTDDELLYNETSTPLYAVLPNVENITYENSELPKEYKPIFKLTKDTWYFYHKYDERLSPLVNEYKSGWSPEQADYIPLQQLYWKYFKDPNFKKGDDRPKDITIPAKETFYINFLYNSQEIKLPVTATYSINQDYRPNTQKQNTGPTGRSSLLNLGIPALILLSLILLVLFRIFRKKSL